MEYRYIPCVKPLFSSQRLLLSLQPPCSAAQLHSLHLPFLFSDQTPGALAQQLALHHWFISHERFSAACVKHTMTEIEEKKKTLMGATELLSRSQTLLFNGATVF